MFQLNFVARSKSMLFSYSHWPLLNSSLFHFFSQGRVRVFYFSSSSSWCFYFFSALHFVACLLFNRWSYSNLPFHFSFSFINADGCICLSDKCNTYLTVQNLTDEARERKIERERERERWVDSYIIYTLDQNILWVIIRSELMLLLLLLVSCEEKNWASWIGRWCHLYLLGSNTWLNQPTVGHPTFLFQLPSIHT